MPRAGVARNPLLLKYPSWPAVATGGVKDDLQQRKNLGRLKPSFGSGHPLLAF